MIPYSCVRLPKHVNNKLHVREQCGASHCTIQERDTSYNNSGAGLRVLLIGWLRLFHKGQVKM